MITIIHVLNLLKTGATRDIVNVLIVTIFERWLQLLNVVLRYYIQFFKTQSNKKLNIIFCHEIKGSIVVYSVNLCYENISCGGAEHRTEFIDFLELRNSGRIPKIILHIYQSPTLVNDFMLKVGVDNTHVAFPLKYSAQVLA